MTCQALDPVPCPLVGEKEGDLVSTQGIGNTCPGSPLACGLRSGRHHGIFCGQPGPSVAQCQGHSPQNCETREPMGKQNPAHSRPREQEAP